MPAAAADLVLVDEDLVELQSFYVAGEELRDASGQAIGGRVDGQWYLGPTTLPTSLTPPLRSGVFMSGSQPVQVVSRGELERSIEGRRLLWICGMVFGLALWVTYWRSVHQRSEMLP